MKVGLLFLVFIVSIIMMLSPGITVATSFPTVSSQTFMSVLAKKMGIIDSVSYTHLTLPTILRV